MALSSEFKSHFTPYFFYESIPALILQQKDHLINHFQTVFFKTKTKVVLKKR